MKDKRNSHAADGVCCLPNCDLARAGSCDNCNEVHYCSREHQTEDWDVHRHVCQTFECQIIETEQHGGKGKLFQIRASRDLQPGRHVKLESPAVTFPNVDHYSTEFTDEYALDLLIEYQPLIVYLPSKPEVCFGCYQAEPDGLKFGCSLCRIPLCSPECEQSPDHKDECGVLRGLSKEICFTHPAVRYLYMDIATLRILLLKRKNYKLFENLMRLADDSRVDSYRKGREFQVLLKAGEVQELLPLSSRYTEDRATVLGACLIALVMGHVNVHDHPTYKCVYPFFSLLPHSCVPNLGYIETTPDFDADLKAEKNTLTLVATVPISVGTGLTVDMISKPFIGKLERQELLRRKSIPRCACPRCISPTDLGTFANAVKCHRCIPGYLLPQYLPRLDWKCLHCDFLVGFNLIYQTITEAAKQLKSILSCDPRFENFQRFQSIWRLSLHPNHHIILSSMREGAKLVEKFILNGVAALRSTFYLNESGARDYRRMRDHCVTLLRFLNASRPGHTFARGKVLRQYFFMDFVLGVWEYKREKIGIQSYLVRLKKGMAVLRESCLIIDNHYGLKAPQGFYNKELRAFLEDLESVLIFVTPGSNRVTLMRFLNPVVNGMLRLDLQNERLLELN